MKNIVYALTVTLISWAGMAVAQEKPSPEETKKVIDYFYNGKGHGVVPMEFKLCNEVSLKGENKNECVSVISSNTLEKGQEAYLWMKFLVPAEEEAKILLQYSRDDMVRDTANVSLGGAIRYRTWKRIPTSTAGKWTVNLVQEMSNADVSVGQLEYSVVE